jgi:enamine deaminase RidA (YjgF/YER057c/UK114 family)
VRVLRVSWSSAISCSWRGTTADNKSASWKVQTEEVLKKIDRSLIQAGSDKSKILWCNVWLTDIREKEQMDAAWQSMRRTSLRALQ